MYSKKFFIYKCNPLSFTSDIFDQPEQDMPHAINVTPAEQEAIGRVCLKYLSLIFSLFISTDLTISFTIADWLYL